MMPIGVPSDFLPRLRMPPPHLDAPTIRELVPAARAISAIRAAFASPISSVERIQLRGAGADLLVMPAAIGRFAGVKSVVVQPANQGTGRPLISGSYVLFDLARGEPVATMDGAALTTLRTPAVSAIAVDALAPPTTRRAVIVGRGVQGHAHIEALGVVRPELTITSIGRDRSQHDRALLREADIVITCTSAAQPVLSLGDVSEHATIVAVGSYRPDRAELTPELVSSCEVWVDELHAAQHEAGDLMQAATAGWDWLCVAGDLVSLCRRPAPLATGRRLFKSVGLATQDLAVAVEAWSRRSRLSNT